MASIFSKIISGEIPSYKIYEDDEFCSFLDINPVTEGHVLIVPKEEVDYLFDLDDTTLSKMVIFAKHIAKAIKQVIPCQRVGLLVVGMEVPHAHIHLIPIKKESDLNLSNPKLKLSQSELEMIANKIKNNIKQ